MKLQEMIEKYYNSDCDRKVYNGLWNLFHAGKIDFDTWEIFYSLVSHWVLDKQSSKVCELRFVASQDVREYTTPTLFPVNIDEVNQLIGSKYENL